LECPTELHTPNIQNAVVQNLIPYISSSPNQTRLRSGDG